MERILGPERPGGQGLDPNQAESGRRAILALLTDPEVRDHVDLVVTCVDDTYEVWSRRGLVRFQRWLRDGDGSHDADRNARVEYRIVEQIGVNPIADQRPSAIATIAEELAAAAASGHPTEDPDSAFIEP